MLQRLLPVVVLLALAAPASAESRKREAFEVAVDNALQYLAGAQNPGGNIGGPGGTVDLRNLSPELAQYTGKRWGELPGEIKTKVVQEMRARYGEDYARNIKLYFEQLAERK